MSEIIGQISQAHRAVRIAGGAGDGGDGGGATSTVLIRRGYPVPIEDVWDACTTAERVGRWLSPVTGDLRLGGTYQLEGNAGGQILRCDPPRLLRVTWVVDEAPGSEVELRLAPGDGAQTTLELEHSAVVDPEFWARYGPGAVGVGWDLALLGLSRYLTTGQQRPADPAAWAMAPEAREFITRSSEAWGAANHEAGTSEPEAAAAVAETTAFYLPPLPGDGGGGRALSPLASRLTPLRAAAGRRTRSAGELTGPVFFYRGESWRPPQPARTCMVRLPRRRTARPAARSRAAACRPCPGWLARYSEPCW